MVSITSIHLPRSCTAVLQRTSDRFPWTEVSKAAQKANGGSGSARDTSQRRQHARTTSQSFCLCQISVHSRICPRMHIYCRVYSCILARRLCTVYMTEAPRVLHFSAFINNIIQVLWLHTERLFAGGKDSLVTTQ